MPDIQMRFHRDIVIVDGAMGTMLQREGVCMDECAEYLNILDPEIILSIHRRYIMAGAMCITTNTFGASRAKLASYDLADNVREINTAGVAIARAAGAMHVLADVGPCGLLLEPLGEATFEQVYDQYFEQVSILAAAGPDAILIETMTDIADARCAVLAAKAACDLPVFVSCAFMANGRMELSGTDPATAAVILEAVGADVVGMNCGSGPEHLLPLAERMAKATNLPLIVQPNAGIPTLNRRGETVFPGTADQMLMYAERFKACGVQFIGSCCGSTPAFTGALYAVLGGRDVVRRARVRTDAASIVRIASPRTVVEIGSGRKTCVIGERINPTGKADLSAELVEGKMSLVRKLAEVQEATGADCIDINVGVAALDENIALRSAVMALTGLINAPLVLDTTDPVALESALRVYPGRALINSVNGDPASYEKVFPLARRYGAAVLVLALDENGIPATLEGRLGIVERVRIAAHEAGLKDNDLIFDPLTMATATDTDAPELTVRTVRALHERGLASVLGVSNVSHGLPSRSHLNSSFASLAIKAGLSAAIVNPNHELMMDVLRLSEYEKEDEAFEVCIRDWQATLKQVLDNASRNPAGKPHYIDKITSKIDRETKGVQGAIKDAILCGDAASMPSLISKAILEGMEQNLIIETVLTSTLIELGAAFERGDAFLPQLILAAQAMKAAVKFLKTLHPTDNDVPVDGDAAESANPPATRGKVIFCTVKGDIHSIGKDICIAMLESQGIEVIDLGVDVSAERIIQAARENQGSIICLSALMTTTLPAMGETVRAVYDALACYRPDHREGADAQLAVFVGGAVVTEQWADSVGAHYSANAPQCAEAVLAMFANGQG